LKGVVDLYDLTIYTKDAARSEGWLGKLGEFSSQQQSWLEVNVLIAGPTDRKSF
jgi:hypothetical protein